MFKFRKSEKSLLKSEGLKYIPTKSLERNKHNPRIIFDEGSLRILRESIEKVGILVPLSVYKVKDKDTYVILDGKRRWMCAKELALDEVPANVVAEPDLITNILTMFNIHNVREPWEITPIALKLEAVMRMTKSKNEKELAQMTGLSVARIHDSKKLLSFDRKYLDMTLVGNRKERISGDFFIQLHPIIEYIKHDFPQIYKKYGKDVLINKMIEKYKDGVIGGVLDFRVLLKTIRSFKKGILKDDIEEALLEIIEKKESTFGQAYQTVAKDIYDIERIEKTCG